uniref:Conserved hypothetical plastid protein n=1 Tax=Bangiopsis subsimplex TaxID=139980 RepID=A0A1C9CCT3_9RHOD|nr:hypothetical protein Bangp_103 [Bangiopsis subsimplex]AOM66185.1 hypothetical protein Bangp_103 [Bangiopsis subsimplex]ARO90455.1 conserved hypothetical plastid protein [Bangiopsis subsimplex]
MISVLSLHYTYLSNVVSCHILPIEWQIILFSDGSLTRHLEILLGEFIYVKIQAKNLWRLNPLLEKFIYSQIPYPRIKREIWLTTEKNVKVIYAISLWNNKALYKHFKNRNIPLGKILIESELDIHKQTYKIELIISSNLEKQFKRQGPFWSRSYFLIHSKNILAFVQEIFSPQILEYTNLYFHV